MQSIISLIEPIYGAFGAGTPNSGDVWGLSLCLLMIVGAFVLTTDSTKTEITSKEIEETVESKTQETVVEPTVEEAQDIIPEPVVPKVSWKDRLSKGYLAPAKRSGENLKKYSLVKPLMKTRSKKLRSFYTRPTLAKRQRQN